MTAPKGVIYSHKANCTCFRCSGIVWNKGIKTGLVPKTAFKKGQKGLGVKKGHIPWNKGTKGIMKAWNKGLKGKQIAWNKGKEFTQIKGNKNPSWQGGKSFEPYGLEFNNKLREQIRERDQYRCQQCFRHQNELNRKLHVHHIDFNKRNNNPENLISLCTNCHSQTQFKRDEWINYFANKQKERGII
jgi:hypothetical protein